MEIQGHRVCVPSANGTNANTADPPSPPPPPPTYHYRNYHDHEDCYKSQRRGRAVARQGTVAVLLISSLKGKPRVEIRAAPRRETFDILRSNSQNRYHPCLRARSHRLSLFVSGHSLAEEIKFLDRRIVYRVPLLCHKYYPFNVKRERRFHSEFLPSSFERGDERIYNGIVPRTRVPHRAAINSETP